MFYDENCSKWKTKKLRGFSFSINIANFEAFLKRIKLFKNFFFLKISSVFNSCCSNVYYLVIMTSDLWHSTTVLPSNSPYLGPGISSELEIVNWKYEVSQLLIHCFTPNSLDNYGAYSIPRKTVNWEECFEICGLEGLKK